MWSSISLFLSISLFAVSDANHYSLQPEELTLQNDENLRLVFATAIWRHGDRTAGGSPLLENDKLKEEDWKQGGGGFNQLTPIGMKQHFDLGRKLRSRYISSNFLSSRYRANEIYVRSTDTNRTLTTAYANLAGMYSNQKSNKPGYDYPISSEWPLGWVPIPVHTVFYPTDHELQPDTKCRRLSELIELISDSDEMKEYTSRSDIEKVLDYLSDNLGVRMSLDMWMYFVNDSMLVEHIHFNDTKPKNDNASHISEWYPWYWSGDYPSRLKALNDKLFNFNEGQGNPKGINGIDVSLEIPRLRAGETMRTIRMHAEGVLHCYRRKHFNDDAYHCESFFTNLKYYALSAHDSTLNAVLALLGTREHVLLYGNPQYAAALLIEFYIDDSTQQTFVKFLYHADENENFRVITPFVSFCNGYNAYCPIENFIDVVDRYDPVDIELLCNTPLP